MRPLRNPHSTMLLVAVLLGAAAGCESEQGSLGLDDLTDAETRYVRRIVVLERAKAVALVDRERGTALLDSLAASWGDSSLVETLADVPADPGRAGAVGRLLVRVLEAERDSLVGAPRPDRLTAPLPVLPPEVVPEEAAGG